VAAQLEQGVFLCGLICYGVTTSTYAFRRARREVWQVDWRLDSKNAATNWPFLIPNEVAGQRSGAACCRPYSDPTINFVTMSLLY